MPKVLRGCGHWEREVCCWFSHVKTFLCRFSKNTCLFNLIWVFDDNWWYSIDFLKLGHHLLKHISLLAAMPRCAGFHPLRTPCDELMLALWCCQGGLQQKRTPSQVQSPCSQPSCGPSEVLLQYVVCFFLHLGCVQMGTLQRLYLRGPLKLPRTEPKFPQALSVDPPRWDNACPVLLGCVQMGSSLWIAVQ